MSPTWHDVFRYVLLVNVANYCAEFWSHSRTDIEDESEWWARHLGLAAADAVDALECAPAWHREGYCECEPENELDAGR